MISNNSFHCFTGLNFNPWQRTLKEAGSSGKPGRCTTNVTVTSHTCRRAAGEGPQNNERCRLRLRRPPLRCPTAVARPHLGRARPRDSTVSARRLWIGWKVQWASATASSTSASRWCRRTCWRSSTCWASRATVFKACQRLRTPVKVRTWRPP